MRRALLLPGPHSGRRTSARDSALVAARFHEAGWTTAELLGNSEAETSTLLTTALSAAEKPDAVVVLGGDGMIHLATQALVGTGVPLGVVPIGTGNDLARELGLPRGSKHALNAADVILADNVAAVDLAVCGGRYFTTVMAAGFDAIVNEYADTMRWPKGNLKYTLAILPVLARYRPIRYILTLDGVEVSTEAVLVAIGNTSSFGGGLRVTEGARPNDGLLDVVVFGAVSRWELIKTYPKLFSGTHISHRAYQRHQVRSVTVSAPDIVTYADGERFAPLPLTIDIAPGALSVFVPPGSPLTA